MQQGDYLKIRMARLAPLIVLAISLFVIGRGGLERLHGPERWAMFLCFVAALMTPILFVYRSAKKSKIHASGAPEGYARTLWNGVLVFNFFAFIMGAIAAVFFSNTVPLRYTILAPGANLLLIALIWRILHPKIRV